MGGIPRRADDDRWRLADAIARVAAARADLEDEGCDNAYVLRGLERLELDLVAWMKRLQNAASA